jgi:hypothetical protein
MKNILIIFSLLLIAACGKTDQVSEVKQGAAMAQSQEHQGDDMAMHNEPEIADDERLIYFTCPMDSHKHISHVDPGKCEECSMDLVAGVITTKDKMDYYGCPMLIHSSVRQDSEGTCEDCGMKLMPMRLVKS